MSEAQSSSEDSDETTNRPIPSRSIDVVSPATVDLVALNNRVVSMRATVKRVKVQVIHKITRRIETLKKKRGTDQQVEKNKRKADRLMEEVQTIKHLKPDNISKFSLANTGSFADVVKQPDVSAETRALARLAEHKLLSDSVKSFRRDHEDWKSLAAFLISRNSGRRFKKKKPNTVDKIITNVRAGEVLVKSYLDTNFQGQDLSVSVASVEENECSDSHSTEFSQVGKTRQTMDISDESSESDDSDETSGDRSEKQQDSVHDEKISSELTTVKPRYNTVGKKQMVIEKINLDEIEDKTKMGVSNDGIPTFLVAEDSEDGTHVVRKNKLKKDSFFVTSDDSDADDEGDDKSDEDDKEVDSADDSVEEDQMERGKSAFHSTFLGSLSEKKWRKSAEERRKPKFSKEDTNTHRFGSRGRGRPGNDSWGSSRGRGRPGSDSWGSSRGRGRPGSDSWGSKQRSSGRGEFRLHTSKSRGSCTEQYGNRSGSHQGKYPQKSFMEKRDTVSKPAKDSALHPSWQASKKRKEQSQIQAFQGKKIKFDDDDD